MPCVVVFLPLFKPTSVQVGHLKENKNKKEQNKTHIPSHASLLGCDWLIQWLASLSSQSLSPTNAWQRSDCFWRALQNSFICQLWSRTQLCRLTKWTYCLLSYLAMMFSARDISTSFFFCSARSSETGARQKDKRFWKKNYKPARCSKTRNLPTPPRKLSSSITSCSLCLSLAHYIYRWCVFVGYQFLFKAIVRTSWQIQSGKRTLRTTTFA